MSNKLTPEELKAITDNLKAATPGPWQFYDHYIYTLHNRGKYPIGEPVLRWCDYNGGFDDGEWCIYADNAADMKLVEDAPITIGSLLAHIAAVERERDDLAALVRVFVEENTPVHMSFNSYAQDIFLCEICGNKWPEDEPENHKPDCKWVEARRALAALDAAAEDGT